MLPCRVSAPRIRLLCETILLYTFGEDANRSRWKDAIRTLAKLHRVDPKAVGLDTFGRADGFYSRQVKTFGVIMEAQSKVKDIETGVAVGYMPHAFEMLDFFKNKDYQPKDRGNIIHGDYKLDNMVFHKTEPRVIGVLE